MFTVPDYLGISFDIKSIYYNKFSFSSTILYVIIILCNLRIFSLRFTVNITKLYITVNFIIF